MPLIPAHPAAERGVGENVGNMHRSTCVDDEPQGGAEPCFRL
jgi:hypothetical protein